MRPARQMKSAALLRLDAASLLGRGGRRRGGIAGRGRSSRCRRCRGHWLDGCPWTDLADPLEDDALAGFQSSFDDPVVLLPEGRCDLPGLDLVVGADDVNGF